MRNKIEKKQRAIHVERFPNARQFGRVPGGAKQTVFLNACLEDEIHHAWGVTNKMYNEKQNV
jgi:hypothetical protein